MDGNFCLQSFSWENSTEVLHSCQDLDRERIVCFGLWLLLDRRPFFIQSTLQQLNTLITLVACVCASGTSSLASSCMLVCITSLHTCQQILGISTIWLTGGSSSGSVPALPAGFIQHASSVSEAKDCKPMKAALEGSAPALHTLSYLQAGICPQLATGVSWNACFYLTTLNRANMVLQGL